MLVLYARRSPTRCGKTAWGRHVYATGDDAEAARLAGIRRRPRAAQRLHRRRR